MIITDEAAAIVAAPSNIASQRRERSLACLSGEAFAARFHAWRGVTGTRYLTTVYEVDRRDPGGGLPDLGPAVLLAVVRRLSGRVIVAAAAVERGSDWSRAVACLHGRADEWHVHLLAEGRAARAAALADLQPAPALAVVA